MTTTPTEHPDVPDWGVDLRPNRRPGIPPETMPHPIGHAHWKTPARQPPPAVTVLKRPGLAELTPVFSTAVPPHGLSGLLRQRAYRSPDQRARKWFLLMLADRVDIVESGTARLLQRLRSHR